MAEDFANSTGFSPAPYEANELVFIQSISVIGCCYLLNRLVQKKYDVSEQPASDGKNMTTCLKRNGS